MQYLKKPKNKIQLNKKIFFSNYKAPTLYNKIYMLEGN